MNYSCFLIGNDTLLMECATILSQSGFQVRGIISTDQQIRTYCQQANLPFIQTERPLESVLAAEPFDFLFSIYNGFILPQSILNLPRQYTINYHDAPLPTYAGVYVTFWALVNQEKEHGITWHKVDSGIDTGAILKQSCFPIEPQETSISLNIKCYSAALAAFRELVSELVSGTLVSYPQDQSRRSYMGLSKRPNLFLDWQQAAPESLSLWRALNFGFHANPFGQLKIRIGHDFFLGKELAVLTDDLAPGTTPPGTLISLTPKALQVAIGNGSLLIRELTTLLGEPVSFQALAQQGILAEGQLLLLPDNTFQERYRQLDRQCAPFQPYWLKKFSDLTLSMLPHMSSTNVDGSTTEAFNRVEVQLHPILEVILKGFSEDSVKIDYLLSAFLITVARLSNQQTVGVGYCSPLSQKLADDSGQLLAACLPLSLAFDWEADGRKALLALQQERKDLDQHGSFAWDWLSCQPTLAPQVKTLQEYRFPVVIHRSATKMASPKHPKALTLLITDDAACWLEFAPTGWQTSQVTDFIHQWLVVLEQLLQDPALPLKTLSLLTPQEQQQLLATWTNTNTAYPRDQTIHQVIEEQVRQRPQSVALRAGLTTLTYEQLNQQANQLARHLQKWVSKPDTLIGICLDRSPAMIIGLLAILKAGGAYVPLDPAYPPARLEQLQQQTSIQLIVTQRQWLNRLPPEVAQYILLDEEAPCWTGERAEDLNLLASADQLAYMLFTSGSTGPPKSVAIPHRGVVRLVKNTNYMRLDSTIVLLSLAPLAFDASTLELWGSLANGGQLVLMTQSQPTLHDIKQTIQFYQVNALFLTTALFNVLIDTGIHELTTLQQILTGGEVASVGHLRRAQQQVPFCLLIHVYGPTESTTFTTFQVLSDPLEETDLVPIGKPVSNTQVYIVDAFLNLVPVGVPGELLIGGDGLARGYLFEPELTAQRFIPDPFRPRSGRRLYRTGDQARYRPDGTLEFLGRLDEQLKIRGFRIEPGEIERTLCQFPDVSQALVVAAELTPGHRALVAYLVPSPHKTLLLESVRAFLQQTLPEHLIPTVLIPLNALPLKASGKVDRSRLPPAFAATQTGGTSLYSPTEAALMPIWTAALPTLTDNLDGNFFELGGSSLLAMQLLARIHHTVGQPVSLKELFEHPTVRQLSMYLDLRLLLSARSVSNEAALHPASPNESDLIDKRQLPVIAFKDAGSPGGKLTQTEAALLPVWQAILNKQLGSLDESFFELGGSSLMAMQLLAGIHLQAGWLLRMSDLFEQPTLRRLSAYIDQSLLPRSQPDQAKPDGENVRFPLSFAQNRLWIIHQIDDLQGAYNVPLVLTINGPIQESILRQSLDEIIRRHQPLQMTFSHRNGVPFQQPGPITWVLSHYWQPANSVIDTPEALTQWINQKVYTPFKLEEGPLIRAHLAPLEADSWVLLLVFHHLIYDGWSTRVLARELDALYSAGLHQQSVSLPDLPILYTEYAQWQLNHYTGQHLERDRSYWKARLAGAPPLLNLPIDKPRPQTQSFAGADYSFAVPDGLAWQLRQGFQEADTTLFLRLVAGFSCWLSQATNTTDLIIGIPVAGRSSRPDLTNSIGFFVNTLALRIDVSPNQTFRQLVRQVRQVALEAYDHQDLPFDQVVDALALPRTLAYAPLVQVMFDLHEDTAHDWQLEGLRVEPTPFQQHMAKFDLHVSIRETPTGLEGTFNYRTDLFSEATIEKLAADFVNQCQQLVMEPDKLLQELAEPIPGPGAEEFTPFSAPEPAAPSLSPPTRGQIVTSPLVVLLQTIWSRLLAVSSIGIEDDFFALGGTPSLAFQMTTELEYHTGQVLAVSHVLANPTIIRLVTHLKMTTAGQLWPSLIAVQAQGEQSPLFLVHPILGDIGYVYNLGAYWPADQPLYGLRAAGLDGITTPLASIEAMARYYVELILKQQPEGAYALGGYSLGGIIAYEMAQQLRQLGRQVRLVALIDSYPYTLDRANPDQLRFSQQLAYYRNVWRSLPKDSWSAWSIIGQKARGASNYLLYRFGGYFQRRTSQTSQQPSSQPATQEENLKMVNKRAYSLYSFKPYDGKLVFLWATGEIVLSKTNRRSVSFGWDRYAQQGVDVHLLPGDHNSIVTNPETVARIADILNSYLH